MAHDVFISYSTKDKPTADAVCAEIEKRSIRCWIAPRDVLPGQDYGEALVDAISASQLMVVVFSSHANDSPQVKREVERAVSKGLVIVPFRLEDVPLSKSLEYFMSTPHWLDALTPPLERHLNTLGDTIAKLLQPPKTLGHERQPNASNDDSGRDDDGVDDEFDNLSLDDIKQKLTDDRLSEDLGFELIKRLAAVPNADQDESFAFLISDCLDRFSSSEHLLCAIAQTLGEYERPESATALVAILETPTASCTDTVLWNAANSLSAMDTPISVETALKLYDGQRFQKVRVALARLLARFPCTKCYGRLEQLMRDCWDDVSDVGHVALALSAIDRTRAASIVLKALMHHICTPTQYWGIDGLIDSCIRCIDDLLEDDADSLIRFLDERYPNIDVGGRRALSHLLVALNARFSGKRQLIAFITRACDSEKRLAELEMAEEDTIGKSIIQEVSDEIRRGLGTVVVSASKNSVWNASDSTFSLKRKSRGIKPTRSITHGSFLWTMEFSPDGAILATADGDGTTRFWNPDDGETRDVVLELDGEHPAIAFHPSARRLATSTNPKPPDDSETESSALKVTVCVWDYAKGSAVSRQTVVDHEGAVEHLHFSASGKRLVCVGGMKSGTAQVWNLSSDCKTIIPHFTLHHRLIIDAFFSVGNEYVASIGSDNSVRLWQTSDGAEYLRLYHDDEVIAGCFAPSADLILSGSKDKTARLWDLATGQQLALFNHDQILSQVAFNPDGTLLVTAADEARVWNALTHAHLYALRHDSDGVLCVAFTPDGRLVITGGCDDTVRVWRATDGCEVARLYHEAYAGEISTIRVSPDGRWLATVADQWSGKVLLWELANLG